MARAHDDVNPPPARGALHTFAVTAVVVLSTLILIAVGLLIYGVLRRPQSDMHSPPQPASRGAAPLAELSLPPQATIEQLQVSGDRLVLELRTGNGQEVDIVDLSNGRLVARIKAHPAARP